MREYRFRAWDGEKYIYFDNHKYDLVYNDITGWNVKPNLPNYKGEWTSGESQSKTPDFTLQQYTGLKDKKGVEIYEGDIFRSETEHSWGDDIMYSVVTWIRERAAFYLIPADSYQVYLDNDLEKEESFDWLFEDANLFDFHIDTGLDLVGNIYENPELTQ